MRCCGIVGEGRIGRVGDVLNKVLSARRGEVSLGAGTVVLYGVLEGGSLRGECLRERGRAGEG